MSEEAELEKRARVALDVALQDPHGSREPITVRGYLRLLLSTLWDEEDAFSGKRPFGNSGWQYDIYGALAKAGLIEGKLNEYGEIERLDRREGDRLVSAAIQVAFR